MTAQIHSEEAYYFADDIDTLLNQLQKNKFKHFDIEIKIQKSKTERFSYERKNDTLLMVFTPEYVQHYYFDKQSKNYQPLDSLFRPYTFPNLFTVRKDSANFRVVYLYEIKQDTTFQQYIRSKTDTKDRFVYSYVFNPQSKSGQEIECIYLNDSTVITKNSIFDSNHRQLLSNDTTTTSAFSSGNTKTIKQNSKTLNGTMDKEPQYFSTTSTSTKTLKYDEKGRIIFVTYVAKASDSRQEKATMKVIFRNN
ncbi:MAG: hypothetical protein Q8L90_11340 [Bacteroidota bacterium]|nr:hypothetical protein [Bacteroidota bacterium]